MIPAPLLVALLDRRLKSQDTRILALLFAHLDWIEYSEVKLAWLGHMSGIPRQHAHDSLKRLTRLKYLAYESRGERQTAAYRLTNTPTLAHPVTSGMVTVPTD